MRIFTLLTLLVVMLAGSFVHAQKLDIVESDLAPLDTATAVSLEFYYRGITINSYVNEEMFLRANRDDKDLVRTYMSSRDSLNEQAFMAGYQSMADEKLPEMQSNNKEAHLHMIVKTVHWQTTFDDSSPDHVVLEFILLNNPGRRLQHGRYYIRKVSGEPHGDQPKKMTSAYFKAGQVFAKALLNYEPEE